MSIVRVDELRSLVSRVLQLAGTDSDNASCVADALVDAECDGLPSHGVARVFAYADQVAVGKVDGCARPSVRNVSQAVIGVDAAHGFAFPAIRVGLERAIPCARAVGICLLTVSHSHHAGVLGHHVEAIANAGLLGLAFSNTPVAMAPWGAARGVFGTNPVAFAAPREDAPPLVIDLSLSVTARGKINLAYQRGEPLAEGLALDARGCPTADAGEAMQGTMVPIGGPKGAALALVVEILAATLTASNYAFEASSFYDAKGPPPSIGQSFILIDARQTCGDAFWTRLEALLAMIKGQPGARLPGSRRYAIRQDNATRGIHVEDELLTRLRQRAARAK